MENSGISGEYGLAGFILLALAIGGFVSFIIYAGLKLGLKNPDDIP